MVKAEKERANLHWKSQISEDTSSNRSGRRKAHLENCYPVKNCINSSLQIKNSWKIYNQNLRNFRSAFYHFKDIFWRTKVKKLKLSLKVWWKPYFGNIVENQIKYPSSIIKERDKEKWSDRKASILQTIEKVIPEFRS